MSRLALLCRKVTATIVQQNWINGRRFNQAPESVRGCACLARVRQTDRKRFRGSKAQLIAELPVVLWVMVLLVTVPCVDMVTFAIRYNFLLAASRDAAFAAGLARTFLADVSASELSAVNAATAAARKTAAAFSEITVNSVTTSIVITDLKTGIVTRQSLPLSVPADTKNYAYQIETVLIGSTNPILQVPGSPYRGAIPGLTSPIPVSIASRAYFENPQGLNE
jgi:hypothetical protein